MQHFGRSIKNKRILLAEDCDDSREILKFLFSKSGALVEAVSNGSECVDVVLSAKEQKRPFDLVIVDIHMPILDGNEAAKKLRAEGYTRPIVAMTGQSSEEEKTHCLQAGCNAFLSKLTSKDQMLHVLESVLQNEEQKEEESFGMPALPFIPKILQTNPEYAPMILKFINSLDQKMSEIQILLLDKNYKASLEVCSSLSNSSFFGYQIFAERLSDLQKCIDEEKQEDALHAHRLLMQATKSIILGRSHVASKIS